MHANMLLVILEWVVKQLLMLNYYFFPLVSKKVEKLFVPSRRTSERSRSSFESFIDSNKVQRFFLYH